MKYWIISIRQLVKSIIKKCFVCQRFESKPYRYPPSLPLYRSQQSLPFETTGLGYLGPVLVKPIFNDIDSNYFHKSQIVLFTCAVARAVHLEVVPNLTESSFICALKRFISRRGIPNLMISDNGTCFKNEEVRLSKKLTGMNISWKFIVPASPWWGGFWERLVQSVKRSLRKTLFRSTLNYEEPVTVVTEIEGIINCRPLIYTYNDNTEEVVTFSHLIYGLPLLSKSSMINPTTSM